MASLIEGYEYDIFISYRQKDNKGDGWVSEFVEALKTELESTFKEDISVYFDINPHNGLLETHDVDESLKEKLKCVIFIPVISRTYCDPKSFAWEHEFKAFVQRASEDEYGLKVKLPNGNVTSRVLPIIIYDLDRHDIKLCESVLGGVLRGVEFIYKTAGVNRPLRSKEEKQQNNLNNTLYRDQVNKVGNTIKDILNSLIGSERPGDEIIAELTIEDDKPSARRPFRKKSSEFPSFSFINKLKNLIVFNLKAWRIIALILFIVSIGSIFIHFIKNPSPSGKAVIRFNIPLADLLGTTRRRALAISPKAEYLVYNMNDELNLLHINSDEPSEPIPGTKSPRISFISPDGKWIGFYSDNERKIMKVSVEGGKPIPICDQERWINDASWYENEIIYSYLNTIYSVPDNGGTPELLYPLIKSESDPIIWNPQILPDKKTLLFSQKQGDGSWSILTCKLGSKEKPAVLIPNGKSGRFLKSGHIVYSLYNRLYICKFSPKTNRIISDPRLIQTNPVMESTNPFDGVSQFDFSENGILVYYEHQSSDLKKLVWVNESGKVTTVTDEAKNYIISAISPDGKSIAVSVNTGEGSDADNHIEIIDIKTGNSQIRAENADWPVWSADNASIIYSSGNQVFQISLYQSKIPVPLLKVDSAVYIQTHELSLDGRYLPFTIGTSRGSAIGYYDMIDKKVKMLNDYNTTWYVFYPTISPDGKWVAYLANIEGYVAVYVAPFPGPGPTLKVSTPRSYNETNFPVWSKDKTSLALYYRTYIPDYEIWKVRLSVSGELVSSEPPQSVFNGGHRFPRTDRTANVEINPDGRFLLMQLVSEIGEEANEPRIKVVVNWEQELEEN